MSQSIALKRISWGRDWWPKIICCNEYNGTWILKEEKFKTGIFSYFSLFCKMFGSIFLPLSSLLDAKTHPKQRRTQTTQTTLTEARILGPKWHPGSGPEQGTQVAIRRAFGAERAVQDLEVSAVFCRFFGVSKKNTEFGDPKKIRQVYVQCECWGDWKVVGKFIYLRSGVMETRKLCKAGRSRSSSHVVTLEKKKNEGNMKGKTNGRLGSSEKNSGFKRRDVGKDLVRPFQFRKGLCYQCQVLVTRNWPT